jgi:hypothetical protein
MKLTPAQKKKVLAGAAIAAVVVGLILVLALTLRKKKDAMANSVSLPGNVYMKTPAGKYLAYSAATKTFALVDGQANATAINLMTAYSVYSGNAMSQPPSIFVGFLGFGDSGGEFMGVGGCGDACHLAGAGAPVVSWSVTQSGGGYTFMGAFENCSGSGVCTIKTDGTLDCSGTVPADAVWTLEAAPSD